MHICRTKHQFHVDTGAALMRRSFKNSKMLMGCHFYPVACLCLATIAILWISHWLTALEGLPFIPSGSVPILLHQPGFPGAEFVIIQICWILPEEFHLLISLDWGTLQSLKIRGLRLRFTNDLRTRNWVPRAFRKRSCHHRWIETLLKVVPDILHRSTKASLTTSWPDYTPAPQWINQLKCLARSLQQ